MARSRNIKPGFFANDALAEIKPLGRLLFAGLWTIADREGRLEDRPKRIKKEVLAYDNCNVEHLLNELAERKFIIRYEVNGTQLIQIATWNRHQNPHKNEPPSVLPPCPNGTSTVPVPEQHSSNREDQRPKEKDQSPKVSSPARARATADAVRKSPAPTSVPKPNRVAEFVDAVTAIDPEIPVAISDQDGAAIKSSSVKPERIAEAYAAAFRGDWDPGGNGWLRDNLCAKFVLARIAGYETHIRAPSRSRNGQTAVTVTSDRGLAAVHEKYRTTLAGGPGG